jgi:hypothetical protein
VNFEIFDDDFQIDKAAYLEELSNLAAETIENQLQETWKSFTKQMLTNTRNYYLLKTALKIMQNLNKTMDNDSAVFNALSFMPDKTFIETTIMIIAKYHSKGKELANHFNVDVSEIKKAESKEKPDKAKQKEENKQENLKENQKDKEIQEDIASLDKIIQIEGAEKTKTNKQENMPKENFKTISLAGKNRTLNTKKVDRFKVLPSKFTSKTSISQISKKDTTTD